MGFSKRITKLGVFSALSATLVLASACSGISQADLDAAKQQAAAAEQKAATMQKDLAAKQQEVTAAQAKLASAEKKALPEGVSLLVGAKLMPPRAPAPTPVPGAPPPPPKPTPPPSYYEPVPFAFYVEQLTSSHGNLKVSGNDVLAGLVACTGSAVFKRGMNFVLRFEVFDTSTGKRLTSKDDGVKITVKFPTETKTANFSQRGGGRVPDAPFMWSSSWNIPLDFPLGVLDYSITVSTKDGRTFTWKQPALVEKGEDTRAQVIE